MKIYIIIFALFIVAQLNAQPPDENIFSYTLVFEDDFNVLNNNYDDDDIFTNVDINKWKSIAPWYKRDFVVTCDLDGDNIKDTIRDKFAFRKQHFENAEIDASGTGIIKLYSKREEFSAYAFDENWEGDTVLFHYSTQMLWSTQAFKYGYYEIRFRLPYSDNPDELYGIGPNFWLWGYYSNCEAPWSEIDVFEYDCYHPQTGEINYHTNNMLYMFCNSKCSTCLDSNRYTAFSDNEPLLDFSDGEFHTMAVKWLPDEISFYVDEVKTRTYTTGNFTPDMLMPMHIFVDVNFPAHNYCHIFDEDEIKLPYIYEVDYVKVWSIDRCNNDYVTCELNTTQYNNDDIFNTIIIGSGTNCENTIQAGENIKLKANKYIHLKKGFHATQGSIFHAEITPCTNIESSTIIE